MLCKQPDSTADRIYRDHATFISHIHDHNYDLALQALKTYFHTNTANIVKEQFTWLLQHYTLNGNTLLELIYNHLGENCSPDTLQKNNLLIQYMLQNDLLPRPNLRRNTFQIIKNRITNERPDAGASLVASFYRHSDVTGYYQFYSRDHKQAAQASKSKPSKDLSPNGSNNLYASCLLNIGRCAQELQMYYYGLKNKNTDKAKLIFEILTAIDQNLEHLVSPVIETRVPAGNKIGNLLIDGNIKKLSYADDPILPRLLLDLAKVVATIVTLGAYPFFWWILHSDSDLDLIEPNRHENFFTFFQSHSLASNIANEICLSLSGLSMIRESCPILDGPSY